MCEDDAGQLHHGKATNRIYGCFFISYFFSWLADVLVGENVGSIKTFFSVMEVRSVFVNSLCRLPSNSVFLLFQGTCRAFSPTF